MLERQAPNDGVRAEGHRNPHSFKLTIKELIMVRKIRTHNEWFQAVKVKTLIGEVTRSPEMVEHILKHSPGMSREILEKPYQAIIGSESSRKSCPTCKAKLESSEFIWSWGEYHNARFRSITHFCKSCFSDNVLAPMAKHTDECGCVIAFRRRGSIPMPAWLFLPETCEKE